MANARWVNIRFSENSSANESLDLHKTYFDDESYNSGHGKAYEFYGVDPKKGAIAIVRPDHCEQPMKYVLSSDWV